MITSLFLTACVTPSRPYQERLDSWDRRGAFGDQAAAELSLLPMEGMGLEELLCYARVHNPALKAAFERWKQALEGVPQAAALPNPRLTFQSYLVEVETRVGPIRGSLGLAQSFPWFGKRELARDKAYRASEVAREMLEEARLESDLRLRVAWFEIAWVEQAISITEGNRDWLTHCESVARLRMSSGLSSHADLIRTQVELGKLEDRVQSLRDLRRPLIARLNAAMNRPVDAEVPLPSQPLATPELGELSFDSSALIAGNPLLRAMDQMLEAAQLGIALADKAFYPDFFIGVDYNLIGSAVNPSLEGSGDDALALKLGFDLPIWRAKYRAGVRAAEAESRAIKLDREAALNRLQSDLEMALYGFRDADRRLLLFRSSLVPKGEESIQALDIAYQSGEGGLLDLIDAQRVLLEFQLQVARAASDRAQALARVERISGLQLNLEQ